MTTLYSDTATEAYTMEWAGEHYTVLPIPAGLQGISLLAERTGVTNPAAREDLLSAIEHAAQDGSRLPQVRTLLRTAADELRTTARLVPGEAKYDAAIAKARARMIEAWKTAPGSWGFTSAPGGIATCILCGVSSPDLRADPAASPYAGRAALHEWYDRHSDLCQPAPRPVCRACVCGGCKAPASSLHECDPCLCHLDDDPTDEETDS